MLITLYALGPTLQHLWISFDSVNADFFAMTLVFIAALDFLLENAIDLKVEGKDGKLDMELRHGKHGILDLVLEELLFGVLCRGSFSKVQIASFFWCELTHASIR